MAAHIEQVTDKGQPVTKTREFPTRQVEDGVLVSGKESLDVPEGRDLDGTKWVVRGKGKTQEFDTRNDAKKTARKLNGFGPPEEEADGS